MKKRPSPSPFSSSLVTFLDASFAVDALRFSLVPLGWVLLRGRFAGLTSSKLRCGEACPPASTTAARLALVSFLATGGAGVVVVVAAVLANVVVVVVAVAVVEAAFARDVARVLVTVCCGSVAVGGSALVVTAFAFRAFFLGTSGGGVSCCECSEAECADSAEAAAAAVRRVERRVAVADMALRARLVSAMRSDGGDVLSSCCAIAGHGTMRRWAMQLLGGVGGMGVGVWGCERGSDDGLKKVVAAQPAIGPSA